MKGIRIATWAYVIIIGGVIMITPGGIGPIVTNPAGRIAIGVVSILLGVAGFIGERKVSATTTKSTKSTKA